MYISGFIEESIVDGSHVRSVVFISGCLHKCPQCHNPETWSFTYGKEFTREEQIKICERVQNNPLVKGLTLSGGDPVYSSDEVIEFIKLYKEYNPNHDIWLYTGFVWEELKEEYIELLKLIDVLVDGRFEICKRDIGLKFKGSSNQRVIDVKESLKQDKVVLYIED